MTTQENNNEMRGEFFIVTFVVILIGLIFAFRNDNTSSYNKAGAKCYDLNKINKNKPTIYNLVSLSGNSGYSSNGTLRGDIFLGIKGEYNQEQGYYLKYAYKDDLGIKIMVEKVNNDSKIRIIEKDTKIPTLNIYKSFSIKVDEGILYDESTCEENPPLKVFEVPKGTILTEYNINLNY